MLIKRNMYPFAILLVLIVVLTTNLYAGSSSNDGEISMFLIVTGLLGGLGMFLYGMEMMSDGMKMSAGDSMRAILEKLT